MEPVQQYVQGAVQQSTDREPVQQYVQGAVQQYVQGSVQQYVQGASAAVRSEN